MKRAKGSMAARLGSWILALCLLVSMTPMVAFADPVEDQAQEPVAEQLLPEEEAQPAEYENGGINTFLFPSEDQLLMEYMEQAANAQLRAGGAGESSGLSRRDSLSEVEQVVYDRLKAEIEQVAAGQRDSTDIAIDVTDLFQGTYTAEDLGVEAIVDGQSVTAEAKQAFSDMIAIRGGRIVLALLRDLPYEFYWFIKSYSTGYDSYYYPLDYDQATDEIVFRLDETSPDHYNLTFRFKLYVAEEFSADGASRSTAPNTELLQDIEDSISLATTIVSDSSGYSDVEKLVYFKDAICREVAYNGPASAGTVSYGNPWQIIYVFDEDDETDVVCEGYAKAFKYLCDLATFQSPLIGCTLQTGLMGGGTGAGNHMWNVVRMDDGQNYLVDVTNCDTGTIGASDYLFLRGDEEEDPYGYTITIPSHGDGQGYYFMEMDVDYTYDETSLDLFEDEERILAPTDYSIEGLRAYLGDTSVEWRVKKPGFDSNQGMTLQLFNSGSMPFQLVSVDSPTEDGPFAAASNFDPGEVVPVGDSLSLLVRTDKNHPMAQVSGEYEGTYVFHLAQADEQGQLVEGGVTAELYFYATLIIPGPDTATPPSWETEELQEEEVYRYYDEAETLLSTGFYAGMDMSALVDYVDVRLAGKDADKMSLSLGYDKSASAAEGDFLPVIAGLEEGLAPGVYEGQLELYFDWTGEKNFPETPSGTLPVQWTVEEAPDRKVDVQCEEVADLLEGYSRADAQAHSIRVSVKNRGSNTETVLLADIELDEESTDFFDFVPVPGKKVVLAPGEQREIGSLTPKTGMPVGHYRGWLTVPLEGNMQANGFPHYRVIYPAVHLSAEEEEVDFGVLRPGISSDIGTWVNFYNDGNKDLIITGVTAPTLDGPFAEVSYIPSDVLSGHEEVDLYLGTDFDHPDATKEGVYEGDYVIHYSEVDEDGEPVGESKECRVRVKLELSNESCTVSVKVRAPGSYSQTTIVIQDVLKGTDLSELVEEEMEGEIPEVAGYCFVGYNYKSVDQYADAYAFSEDRLRYLLADVRGDVTLYACWLEELPSVSLTATLPGCGISPGEATVEAPANAKYTVDAATWYESEDGQTPVQGNFQAGRPYYLKIDLHPLWGYLFPEDRSTLQLSINGVAMRADESGYNGNPTGITLLPRVEMQATHDLEKIDAVAAGCLEGGNLEYYKCKHCGSIFKDAEGQEETPLADMILPALGHRTTHVDASAAGCITDGWNEHYRCQRCGKLYQEEAGLHELSQESVMIPKTGHDFGAWTPMDAQKHQRVCSHDESHVETAPHSWDAGKVTQAATTDATGIRTYSCAACGATREETIPKIDDGSGSGTTPGSGSGTTPGSGGGSGSGTTPGSGSDPNQKGEGGSAIGKGASAAAAEKAISASASDEGPAGSKFSALQLRSPKQTKNSVKLSWTKAPGASKYVLYGNMCGKGKKYKKIGTYTGSSVNVTKAAGAKLKKGSYYKFMMVALDKNNNVVSSSKTVHVATKGGKVGNHKSVMIKAKVNKKGKAIKSYKALGSTVLKKGKSLKLKVTATPASKKLKVKKHRKICFESSDPKVASVSKAGVVKGKKKGTCYIYAYAQNGVTKRIKITVK